MLDLLDYNPETGVLVWKKGRRKGHRAGGFDARGYRQIQIDGAKYREHRVIWFMQTGEWPKEDIDHINGDRGDNRWCNLRDVSRRVNTHNRAIHRAGKIPGVAWIKGAWNARGWHYGREYYLGRHKTEKAAALAAASIDCYIAIERQMQGD